MAKKQPRISQEVKALELLCETLERMAAVIAMPAPGQQFKPPAPFVTADIDVLLVSGMRMLESAEYRAQDKKRTYDRVRVKAAIHAATERLSWLRTGCPVESA